MLSAKAKYGLKALVRLAREPQLRAVLGADLAAKERIPKKFLEQILLDLKHRGLLQTRRGRNGGYHLMRPPSEITVGEIVRALDGPIAPLPCVSLSAHARACDDCLDEATCGTHLVMQQVRDSMSRILDSTTLADVVRMIAAASAPPVLDLAPPRRAPSAPRRPAAAVLTDQYPGPRRFKR
jgi:Rrf2 family protein